MTDSGPLLGLVTRVQSTGTLIRFNDKRVGKVELIFACCMHDASSGTDKTMPSAYLSTALLTYGEVPFSCSDDHDHYDSCAVRARKE